MDIKRQNVKSTVGVGVVDGGGEVGEVEKSRRRKDKSVVETAFKGLRWIKPIIGGPRKTGASRRDGRSRSMDVGIETRRYGKEKREEKRQETGEKEEVREVKGQTGARKTRKEKGGKVSRKEGGRGNGKARLVVRGER